MSIPDPTIDPVTGLPVLNPQTPIQQIPLGADVFPFADLKASSQPARGPIYGDDIIPTSSLLSGQHPTLGNAQTVQTDGSHAAKVYVVNESGGGGTVTPIVDPQSESYFHGTSPFALPIHQFTVFPFTLYGWSLGYTINPTTWTPPIGSSIELYVQGDTTGKQIY